jgi:hypothetical protein
MTSCTRLRQWFKPEASPEPLHFNTTTTELLKKLGTPTGAVVDELLVGANAAYDEATSRMDSAERRAVTIQGTIAIAASLTVAGGSLLLEPSKVPSQLWRVAIGIGFSGAVVLLAIGAWRAFLVTWPRFMWASPAATDTVKYAAQSTAEDVKLLRICDLLVAYGRNDSVARLKLALLRQSVRWLMSALALLALLAILVAAYAIERSPSLVKSDPPSSTRSLK